MFVVGSVRSGSTAFAISKALELQVPYAGDLSYTSVHNPVASPFRINAKDKFHEVGYNPSFTISEYVTSTQNLDDPTRMYLLPANLTVTHCWNDAVGYITRRNIKNIARSLFCYMQKVNANRAPSEGEMFSFIERSLIGATLLLEYCKQANKQMTWYEDVFDVQTTYTTWETTPYKASLEARIDKLLQELDPQSINPNIITT